MYIINVKNFCLKGLVALSVLAVSASYAGAQDYVKTTGRTAHCLLGGFLFAKIER